MPEQMLPSNDPHPFHSYMRREVVPVLNVTQNEKISLHNPWNNILKTEIFERGKGWEQVTVNYLPSHNTEEVVLHKLDERSNTYPRRGRTITQAWETHRFTLGMVEWSSMSFNMLNLYAANDIQNQLKNYLENLKMVTDERLAEINQQGFIDQVEFKLIARSEDGEVIDGFSPVLDATGKTRFKNLPATSVPTRAFMNKVVARLARENTGSVYNLMGTAKYQCICSREIAEFMMKGGGAVWFDKQNGIEMPNRKDVRYISEEVKAQFEHFTDGSTYDGIQYIENDLAPRYKFNYAKGGYERVMPFKLETRIEVGYAKQTVHRTVYNPEYDSAPYEAIVLFAPDTVNIVTIPDVKNWGNGIDFKNAASFNGQWEFFTPLDTNANPFGVNGYFRYHKILGFKPIEPKKSAVIMVLRPQQWNLYASAQGNHIPLGGKNTEDAVFYDDPTKVASEFDADHIATIDEYNTYINIAEGMPQTDPLNRLVFTGAPDAVHEDKNYAIVQNVDQNIVIDKETGTKYYTFLPGQETLVIPVITPNYGVLTVEKSGTDQAKLTLGTPYKANPDTNHCDLWYVEVRRTDTTSKIDAKLTFKHDEQENLSTSTLAGLNIVNIKVAASV